MLRLAPFCVQENGNPRPHMAVYRSEELHPQGGRRMTAKGLDILDDAIAEAEKWTQEIAEDLATIDRPLAYSALRAVLQVTRDHLPADEAITLASHLPAIVRGFYYEGWRPTRRPAARVTRE